MKFTIVLVVALMLAIGCLLAKHTAEKTHEYKHNTQVLLDQAFE